MVEDDSDLLNLMNLKLTQEGFETVLAETGSQALDFLKNQPLPDLVLLDILLPDIDGLSVLNEIANSTKTKTLPVIILSNLADEGSFEQAEAIGHYEYLVKAKTDLNTVVQKVRSKLGMK